MAATGSLANPTVTAQSGGTFQLRGSHTMGGTNDPNITIVGGGATAAGTLSLADGAVNTLTLTSATPGVTVLNLGGIATAPAQLGMNIGATSDQIVLANNTKALIGTAGVTLTVNPNGAFSPLGNGTHTLISAPGGGLTSGGGVTVSLTTGNFGGKSIALGTPSDTQLDLVVTDGAAMPSLAYFKGAVDGYWNGFSGGNANNSNWTTDAAGATDPHALPASGADIHFYAANATTANLVTTLGQNFTVKTLTVDGGTLANAVSVAPGGGTLTVTPASSAAGIAVNGGAGALTVSAPVVLGADQTWTNNSAGALTVSGALSGNKNLAIDAAGTGAIVLAGANTAYSGTTTLTAGTLIASNTGATNVLEALGTGGVVLNAGILSLRANGSGSYQTVVTGDGLAGSNVTVGGNAGIDVQRYSGSNTNNVVQLNNLAIGANQLDVTGANAYNLNVAGTTTIAGAATLNPASAPLNLLGKVSNGGNAVSVTGTAPTRLLNTASGAGANAITGTWTVNGGVLQGYAPPADAAAAGSNSLGTATIALSGTNPVVRLAPNLAGGLSTFPSAGLVDKSYTGVTSNAATNFLGATQPITTGTGGQNLSGNQIVSDINIPTGATATTSSHQYTGLLNIGTAGVYNIKCDTDDNGSLVVDGNAPIVTSNSNVTSALYLTPGLHTFSLRWNNNSGNGRAIASYQGPDTAGAMIAIPAGAFSYTTPSLLATNFGNNVTFTAGSNATIENRFERDPRFADDDRHESGRRRHHAERHRQQRHHLRDFHGSHGFDRQPHGQQPDGPRPPPKRRQQHVGHHPDQERLRHADLQQRGSNARRGEPQRRRHFDPPRRGHELCNRGLQPGQRGVDDQFRPGHRRRRQQGADHRQPDPLDDPGCRYAEHYRRQRLLRSLPAVWPCPAAPGLPPTWFPAST